MSYLNPANISTDLGVDLDPLRRLRSSAAVNAGPDRIALAHASQAAGADAVLISLCDPLSNADVAEFEQLMASIMVPVDLAITPSDASTALVRRLLPRTVKLTPTLRAANSNQGQFEAVDFGPVRQLSAQLYGTGINVIVSLPTLLEAVDAAHVEGVRIIELDASPFAMAKNPAEASAALTALHQTAAAGVRHGIGVRLAGGVNYHNIRVLAALDVFSQINCGHAIAVHALTVGWTRAVADMKALTVPAVERRARVG